MKKSVLIMLLLLAGPLYADTETEIKTALDYFEEVWSEGDLESIRGYYHPDFVLVDENGITALQQRMEVPETISLKFKDGSSFSGWFTTMYVNTPFGWKAILSHN